MECIKLHDNVHNQFLERLAITGQEEYNTATFSSEPRQLSVNLSVTAKVNILKIIESRGTPMATNLKL